MIYGDNRPHNVALVVPGAEIAGHPMAEAEAHARIRAEIDRLSADWKPFERVITFALIAEDFTQESGLLTPSLKIRRRHVVERYRAKLDALYDGGSNFPLPSTTSHPRPGPPGEGRGEGSVDEK